MSIDAAMKALKQALESHTNVMVTVGAPGDAQAGLYLHPYSVEETMELRSRTGDPPGMRVRLFLSVRPETDYSILESAMECLRENSVMLIDGVSIGISRSMASPAELAPIFGAMDIPYRMTVPYEIRITAPSDPEQGQGATPGE